MFELDEQHRALKYLHSMTMPKGRGTWNDKDTDGDGKITKGEWRAAMQAIVDKAGEEHLLWAIIRSWDDHPLTVEIRQQPDISKQRESLRVRVEEAKRLAAEAEAKRVAAV